MNSKLTFIMSAQVGCEGAALEAVDFFAADFLADIIAIYDYEICLEDVLKDGQRMEKGAGGGNSGG
jgi:hypothetical protein